MTATMGGRYLHRVDGLDDGTNPNPAGDGEYFRDSRPVDDPYEANLISSRWATAGVERPLPTLDVDHPCRLVESSPGRFHLFIDVPVPWAKYVDLLRALDAAGIIEHGWAEASIRQHVSVVRLRPGEKHR